MDEKGTVVSGDPILTSLKMMEVIIAKKKTLSELTADLVILSEGSGECNFFNNAAVQAEPDVRVAAKNVSDALGNTGRILVRESDTELILRVMVEVESEELCREYADQLVKIVHEKGHIQ